MRNGYQVQRWEDNTWNVDADGVYHPVIRRDCGHVHRTIRSADRCLQKLLAYDPRTQMWSAAWHRAEVVDLTTGRVANEWPVHYAE